MIDLPSWLLEQIAEDERIARQAGEGQVGWATYRDADGGMLYTSPVASHGGGVWVTAGEETSPTTVTVLFDQARLLAECDAKRRIVEQMVPMVAQLERWVEDEWGPMGDDNPGRLLRVLALPFADREGYREEWRP